MDSQAHRDIIEASHITLTFLNLSDSCRKFWVYVDGPTHARDSERAQEIAEEVLKNFGELVALVKKENEACKWDRWVKNHNSTS